MQIRGNLHRYRLSPVRKKIECSKEHVCPVIALYRTKKLRLWSLINSTKYRL